jgi:hypothetical protein
LDAAAGGGLVLKARNALWKPALCGRVGTYLAPASYSQSVEETNMAEITDTSADDGLGGFGGEKLRQYDIQQAALPDRHANSTGHQAPDDRVAGSEFSGLEMDPIRPAPSGGDGLGPAQQDRSGLDGEMDARRPAARADRPAGDADETSAGGIGASGDEAEETPQ